jgi:Tfp pilus assembly protein PilO
MALLDPIANAPKPQKIALGVIGLGIVAALGYFLLLAPGMQERDNLHQRNDALRAEVARAQADEANLRAFRAQAAALRKRLEVAKERLPSEKEMPRLYRQITDIAAASGLGVALFAPKPPDDKAVLAEVPISMTAEATYHQMGAFFDRVGRLPRIVALGDFKWTGIERPTGTVRAEMTLSTYIFREEGATTPPAKPGAPAAAAPGAPPAPPARPSAPPAGPSPAPSGGRR